MALFENVKQPKLAEVIAARVREEIRSGAIEVGTQLPPERELIDVLGVSRGTLREALTLLESQGFIDIKTGRNGGVFITKPTVDNMVSILDVMLSVHDTPLWQLLETREYIEPIATALACERATSDDIEKLESCVESLEKASDNSDEDLFREQTVAFHVLIADASHNELIRTLTVITQNIIFRSTYDRLTVEPDATVQAHRRILDAIKDRNVERATDLMHRHVSAFEKHVEAGSENERRSQIL